MQFTQLGLSADLLRAVDKQGYREATPVQQQAIPVILEGRDVLGCAQTGTGKTAGFTLPLLQRLSAAGGGRRQARALVLTPTRELAAQVHESVRQYGRYLELKSAEIYGGVSARPQVAALARGVDIVVATPGRLLDLAQQGALSLGQVEILVLDEADRMLDMGFIRDIRRILKLLPAKRQNLLFSATFNPEIRSLAESLLHEPVTIDVTPRNSTVERVAQVVHPVDKPRKRALLSKLVSEGDWRQVLVFTRTKHGANRLAGQLEDDGLGAVAIHGNKSQGARQKALKGFKDGRVRVLVATDIAARGLDIDRLPHVVNYELPNVPEDYVHRIGRTARAGHDGSALSLVSADEHKQLADIEKLLKTRLERRIVAGFEPRSAAAAPRRQEDGGRAASGRPPRKRQRRRGRSRRAETA